MTTPWQWNNIIKRVFSHHRDLIKIPGSTLSDKIKFDSSVQHLTSKINCIQTKIDKMDDENISMNKYIIIHFVLTNAIFMPLLFFKF